MAAAVRRFLSGLFGGPVTIQGMSAEAEVDAGLAEAHRVAAGEEEARATLGAAGRGWVVERNAELRFLGKRFARRR